MGYKPLSALAGLLLAAVAVSGCQTSRPIAHRPAADHAWNNPRTGQTPAAAVDGQAPGPLSTAPAPSGAALDTAAGPQSLTGKQPGPYPPAGNSSSNLNGASSGGPAPNANPGGAGNSLSSNGMSPVSLANPPMAPLGSAGTGLQEPAPPATMAASASLGAGPGADQRPAVDPSLAPAMPAGGNEPTRQTANMSPVSALIKPYPAEPTGLSTAAPAASALDAADDVPVLKPGQPQE